MDKPSRPKVWGGLREGVSRRAFLGMAGAGTAAAMGATWFTVSEHEVPFESRHAARPTRQPNFLVILADDLGWGDLSCYGAPSIRTPQLDRLAASGVRFTDGYSASSVCSPTRFGLYTGRFPGRLHGGLQEPIGQPARLDGIPAAHPTLASLLRDAGYRTAMFGKWHCGYLPWFSPTRAGWDEFFGNFGGAIDYFSKVGLAGEHDLYEGEVKHRDLGYYTHLLAERAVHFVHRRHDRPWLLNLNFTSPHWPWEGPTDRAVSDDVTARVRAGDGAALAHDDGGSLDVYRAMVEDMDTAVGSVLDALDATGQRKNTIVLFQSDNGGERYSYTWPFSGGKFTLYEGGIRVPTIFAWPGTLRGGQVSAEPVITMDWTATAVDLAGAEPASTHPLDGKSLAPYLLDGAPRRRSDLFWRMSDQAALRRGHLKYLRTDDGEEHLFDLHADVHEQADLVDLRVSDVDAMREAWTKINETLLPYE